MLESSAGHAPLSTTGSRLAACHRDLSRRRVLVATLAMAAAAAAQGTSGARQSAADVPAACDVLGSIASVALVFPVDNKALRAELTRDGADVTERIVARLEGLRGPRAVVVHRGATWLADLPRFDSPSSLRAALISRRWSAQTEGTRHAVHQAVSLSLASFDERMQGTDGSLGRDWMTALAGAG